MSKAHLAIEDRRQAVQSKLDGERSSKERNALGQFATPPLLAREITKAALAMHDSKPLRFLEPSVGSGAFFSALLSESDASRVAAAQGFDVDDRFVAAARDLWGGIGLNVLHGDFTVACPPTNEGERSTLILANPPYVRHHHLCRSAKVALQSRTEDALGIKVSGLAGLYVYFMLLAHEWLADEGVGAWLVPTEWMDTNYGAALRSYLCTQVSLVRVHRFDSGDAQFGDALVSSSVVFLRKSVPNKDLFCELTAGGTLADPASRVSQSVSRLRGESKWTGLFKTGGLPQAPDLKSVTLGDLLFVKRGVATGCNEFFVRPREEFRDMGIPDEFLRPVLPSSRHLLDHTVEADEDGYPRVDVPLALLDCDVPEDLVRKYHPKLWAYLESTLGQSARMGYLARSRKPWYSQEQRPHAPIVSTYMGRGRKGGKPFRFFWNKSQATATNVYLLLIPKGRLAHEIALEPAKARFILDFLVGTDVNEIVSHGRVYGGGLHKLEPKELAGLDASRLVTAMGLAVEPTRKNQLGILFDQPTL